MLPLLLKNSAVSGCYFQPGYALPFQNPILIAPHTQKPDSTLIRMRIYAATLVVLCSKFLESSSERVY